MAQELDGLQFAAELEFQDVANGKVVACRESQRLQRGIVQVGIGRRKTANGEGHGRLRSIRSGDGNSWCARRPRASAAAVADIAADGEMSVGEDRALEGEAGAHVGSGAVAACGRTGEEGETAALFRDSAFSAGSGRIVKDAQNRAVRDRAQSPLPVIVVGKSADGTELHHAQQRAQRDVDVESWRRDADRLSRATPAGKKER